MSVVDAVAIEPVIEAKADCSDRDRAQAALVAALQAARGPRRSSSSSSSSAASSQAKWRLDMNVSATAPGIRAADARIRDDSGAVVAERTVSDKSQGSCVALARAVSAWAQIVLDDELVRAHDDAERAHPDRELPESRPIVMTTSRPTVPDADNPSPFSSTESKEPVARMYEVGTMLFLRNGAAPTGGMFGVAPFATVSFSERWVIRPSLAIGTSTSRVPPDQSNSVNIYMFGGRLDLCGRMPGNYIDHRGIEFDICAGGDAARVWSNRATAFRGSVGPSGVLRGEIGQNFGLEFRTMVGVNLARSADGFGDTDLPPFVAAAELGASVRFR